MFIDRHATPHPPSVRRSGNQLELHHSGPFRSSERNGKVWPSRALHVTRDGLKPFNCFPIAQTGNSFSKS